MAVDPDIEVLDDPRRDEQKAPIRSSRRAVDEVLKSLGAQPVAAPQKSRPTRIGREV